MSRTWSFVRASVRRLIAGALLAIASVAPVAAADAPGQAQTATTAGVDQDDGVAVLLEKVRVALEHGDRDAYLALLDTTADVKNAEQFLARAMTGGVTRVGLHERDRGLLLNGGYSVVVDVFTESGRKGRIDTFQFDVKAGAITDARTANEWRILGQEPLTVVEGLYRLAIDTTRQFAVHDLVLTAEDLAVSMPTGTAFVGESDEGVTALVLLGRGEAVFTPAPEAERTQVRLFCGQEQLRASFDSVFMRLNPAELKRRMTRGTLVAEPVSPRALKRAEQIFGEDIGKSFGLDLSDLSRDRWSLTPPYGDFLAELRTRKFGALTYAQASSEAEDITLFDRANKRNISVYSSARRLAARGRSYSEDGGTDFDVEHYDLDVEFDPARQWVEGTARVRIKVKAFALGTLTFKLAEPFAVRSIRADKFGRVMAVRVLEQNSVIVNLPKTLERDATLTLTVAYGGRLPPPPVDREALTQDVASMSDLPTLQPEARVVYSTRSYWYPQGPVADYASAVIKVTVPSEFDAVATGEPAASNPVRLPATAGKAARKIFLYSANQPVRYLSVLVSKLVGGVTGSFDRADTLDQSGGPPPETTGVEPRTQSGRLDVTLRTGRGEPLPAPPDAALARAMIGNVYRSLNVSVVANPRQVSKVTEFRDRAAGILAFYADLVDDIPYPSFTLALVDNALPGGHSPGYFALLNQPLPTTPYVWRNDPVVFDNFPDFFLAHEAAHQYWGQAVGWKNYHEQWISEGFAQYFALLYAEKTRPETFGGIIRQLRRTALAQRGQGPIYLGYRLGHVRGEGRVFRALVYNKGALVLHMLRRYLGDEVFFAGLKRFYRDFRFRKAGTDDVRAAFEAASGVSLERFFDRWIYEEGVPDVSFSYTESGDGAHAATTRAIGGALHDGSRAVFDQRSAVLPGAIQDPSLPRGSSVLLRLEQRGDLIYDLPLTASIRYQSGESEDVVVRLNDRVVEYRHPTKGPVREVRINDDQASLVEIRR
ncbi:MAG: M1 family aminopeptidase [Vicinamibacterales bacterium]